MSPSDQVLLRQWTAQHDADAFAELVRRHAAMVHGTAARILRTSADAEDVAQECFIKLARSGAAIDRTVAGWLHTVATRQALDAAKSRGRRQKREQAYGERRNESCRSGWEAVGEEVDEAIEALPAGIRDVVVAHYLEGRTYSEIADDWKITRDAVAMRASRGVAKVRQHLKRKGFIVPAGVLVSGLASQAAHATPPQLLSTLGKVALSGGAASSGGPGLPALAVTLGGIVVMKKTVVVAAAAVVCVVAGLSGAYYTQPTPRTLLGAFRMGEQQAFRCNAIWVEVDDEQGAMRYLGHVALGQGDLESRVVSYLDEREGVSYEILSRPEVVFASGDSASIVIGEEMGTMMKIEVSAVALGSELIDLRLVTETRTMEEGTNGGPPVQKKSERETRLSCKPGECMLLGAGDGGRFVAIRVTPA